MDELKLKQDDVGRSTAISADDTHLYKNKKFMHSELLSSKE